MDSQEKVILLVEDNPGDVELTQRALRKNNILNKVVVAHDGVEALAYLFGAASEPPRKLPQVVLLDLNMPKVSGLEVLLKIRANGRTRLLPVVILTTSREDRDVLESYALGVNSYVQKPVDFVQFSEAIRQLGLYWLVVNITAPAVDRR